MSTQKHTYSGPGPRLRLFSGTTIKYASDNYERFRIFFRRDIERILIHAEEVMSEQDRTWKRKGRSCYAIFFTLRKDISEFMGPVETIVLRGYLLDFLFGSEQATLQELSVLQNLAKIFQRNTSTAILVTFNQQRICDKENAKRCRTYVQMLSEHAAHTINTTRRKLRKYETLRTVASHIRLLASLSLDF